jgi:signal transduction protein with GAF and PtsI domain
MNEGFRPDETFDLRDIGVSEGPPDLAFNAIVALASRSVCAPLAILAIVDQGLGVVRVRARHGFASESRKGTLLPLGLSFTGVVVETGSCLAVPDARLHPKTARHPFLSDLDARSLLAAPVSCPRDEAIGSLVVFDRLPRIWTEGEKQVLNDCAFLCSQSILLRAALRTLAAVARGNAATSTSA